MEKNSKQGINIFLILSIILLAVSVGLFFLRQAEIDKRVELQHKVDDLTKEKIRLAKELDETSIVKKDLEVQLSSLKERASMIEKQLEDEKRAKDSAFSQLETEKREAKRLVDELIRLKDEKEKVSVDLANLNNERDSLKRELERIQAAKEVLEKKMKDLLARNEIELEKIVVKPEAISDNPANTNALPQPRASAREEFNPQAAVPQTPAAGIQGEILVVNKKFDFVVVNLGLDNGLEVGMNLGVYRNQKLLAMLQVEKVHANMAAAKIPPEWKSVDLKEGDMVALVQ